MALTDAKLIVIEENLIQLIVVEDRGQVGLKVEPVGSPISCSASDRCWKDGDQEDMLWLGKEGKAMHATPPHYVRRKLKEAKVEVLKKCLRMCWDWEQRSSEHGQREQVQSVWDGDQAYIPRVISYVCFLFSLWTKYMMTIVIYQQEWLSKDICMGRAT